MFLAFFFYSLHLHEIVKGLYFTAVCWCVCLCVCVSVSVFSECFLFILIKRYVKNKNNLYQPYLTNLTKLLALRFVYYKTHNFHQQTRAILSSPMSHFNLLKRGWFNILVKTVINRNETDWKVCERWLHRWISPETCFWNENHLSSWSFRRVCFFGILIFPLKMAEKKKEYCACKSHYSCLLNHSCVNF